MDIGLNLVVNIIGLVLVILGITGLFIKKKKDETTETNKKVVPKMIVAVGLCVFIFGFSFEIVPTGYTGVRTTFGQVSEAIVSHGFNLQVPFVQQIELVNNKQQDTVIDAQVWGESSEKTPVYATEITVTYQVNPAKSAWIFKNVTTPKDLISQSIISSAIKSAMVELNASEVTVRSKIEPRVKEKLADSISEKYGEDTITILKVVINQMDFEESYNSAISERSIALQIQEKQKIENETAIAKAEADKKVKIANAEAQAESMRITAEAEAEANRLLNESLSEAILKSKFYESWNGVLPKVMGEGTVITDISE